MTDVCCCALCHREYPEKDLIPFDGRKICLGCMVWHTRTCSYCGKYIWKKDALVYKDRVLCARCTQERQL